MGKANAAMGLTALLTDDRFDFTNAYLLSTGCCCRSYGDALTSSDSSESADIFETAMKNNFAVGRILIDAICDQTLSPALEN